MRSLLGGAIATMKSPVPLSNKHLANQLPLISDRSDAAQLDTFDESPEVFTITDRNGETFAAVDWSLYRTRDRRGRLPGGEDRREVTSHAAIDTLESPNDFMTGHDLRYLWSLCMDLVGKCFWLPVTAGRGGFPVELWPIPPHLIKPVPDPENYLRGWAYFAPSGEIIPLGVDEVIASRRPHPKDPYGSSSPINALMVDIDANRQASKWNASFFYNSAIPGGVIEFPEGISDTDWDEFQTRWNEQHQGVANAHRVATIERGKWVSRTFTMRDMEFSQLRQDGRASLLFGFGFPKTMAGQTEEVNRATALAAKTVHADAITLPKLRRFKAMLNRQYLPRFSGDGLVFDHDDPTPQDEEAEDAHRASVADTAAKLAELGYNPDQIGEWMEAEGLPRFDWLGWPEASQRDTVGGVTPQAQARGRASHHHHGPRRSPTAQDDDDRPSVAHLQEQFDRAMERILPEWSKLEQEQKAALIALLATVLTERGLDGLEDLEVDSEATAALLSGVMVDSAVQAAGSAVVEAAEQGVFIEAPEVDDDLFAEVAVVVAVSLAARLIVNVRGTVLREWSTGGDAVERQRVVDRAVSAASAGLDELTLAQVETQVGGAVTGAQNEGRILVADAADVLGDVYANEVNDSNTCDPCARIDGKPLGTTNDIAAIRAAYPAGGFGGYVDCEGRERCRGTIEIRWRDGG